MAAIWKPEFSPQLGRNQRLLLPEMGILLVHPPLRRYDEREVALPSPRRHARRASVFEREEPAPTRYDQAMPIVHTVGGGGAPEAKPKPQQHWFQPGENICILPWFQLAQSSVERPPQAQLRQLTYDGTDGEHATTRQQC